ncbi:ABC transporter ATP-binding protein [Corynebacterium lizhenjunii]|uniref:ABC transporter ATP-binding protein n=1 Tax=Corynebacterium lizhenjunii TaxID=2709394 RepID=A0A7T0PA13_9CORY|nr:ABC transporter ATP-binding protein [Corynebacterium lizhenjunii]QPK79363.1 ABC transporter ATP-binding protein [Corynebacterium lizhenjunii]
MTPLISPVRARIAMCGFFLRHLPARAGALLLTFNLFSLGSVLFPTAVAVALTGQLGSWNVPQWTGIAYFVLVMAAVQLLGPMAGSTQIDVATRLAAESNQRIAQSLSSIKYLDDLEDSQLQEALSLLRSRDTVLGEAMVRTFQAVVNLSVPVLLVAAAALSNPHFLWILPACVPALWAGIRAEKLQELADTAVAPHQRKLQLFAQAVAGSSLPTELRVYRASDWYLRTFAGWVHLWNAPLQRTNLRITWLHALASCFYFGAGGLIVWRGADSLSPQASLVSVFTIMQLATLLSGLRFAYADLSQAYREYARFQSVLRAGATPLTADTPVPRQSDTVPPQSDTVPTRSDSVITLDRVCYTYPGASAPALHEVSLQLPRASLIAVMGQNGSGKSTLAMLLRDVRRPSSGTLSWNSRSYTTNAEGTRVFTLAGIPQQPSHWELTAYEAATLPQAGANGPFAQQDFALEASGAAAVFRRLPRGKDTHIGASWDDGVKLSGGQWQRLGNCRGLLGSHEADLVVIDEPTSALDAHAEAHLLHSCRQIVAGSDHGTSVVLITHRVSSALRSDFVVLFDQGRVVAAGPPRELLRTNSAFAELVAQYGSPSDD